METSLVSPCFELVQLFYSLYQYYAVLSQQVTEIWTVEWTQETMATVL